MKKDAIVLLGPTGSGKTPLGDCLERRGFNGRRCIHFDFGVQLRRIAEDGGYGLPDRAVQHVRHVLRGSALLENETFYIARSILEAFVDQQQAGKDGVLVMNGLPRHTGQARDVGDILNVILVVALECTAATVYRRIEANSGGDRAERADDSIAEIRNKLAIYEARTRPLIEHYRSAGVSCRMIPVDVDTAPEDIIGQIEGASHTGRRNISA